MLVRDLMQDVVVTVHADDLVSDLLEFLMRERFHGAPVLSGKGELVGVVSQQDIFFSQMTQTLSEEEAAAGAAPRELLVKEIMTSPAVSIEEETDVKSLCDLMWKLGIHRMPVLRKGQVTGIVSSLDVCSAIARGELEI